MDLRIPSFRKFVSYRLENKIKKKQMVKEDIEFIKQNVKEFQNSDLKKSLLNLGNKITTEDK
jgi:hypothetical protein